MKYLALLALLAVIYLILRRQAPVASVTEAVAQAEVAPLTQGRRDVTPGGSNPLKRPLDRTHDVLDKVKERNGTGEF